MFGDIAQPQPIGVIGAELAAHEIIMSRRSGNRVFTLTGGDRRADSCDVTQAPHAPLRDPVAQISEVISKDLVAPFRVLLVQDFQDADQVLFFFLPCRERLLFPFVVCLGGKPQGPGTSLRSAPERGHVLQRAHGRAGTSFWGRDVCLG